MIYLLIAAAVCAADQLLKLWIASTIPLGGTLDVLPGFMCLTHVRNTGMAFSMLSEHTWLLTLTSAVVSCVLAALLVRGKFPRWEKIALALVLGGAVGNLIDRVRLGYVVDMFRTLFVDFAVFNLADAFIDVGAALFCVLYIIRTVREERAKKTEGTPHDSDADRD